MQRPSVQFCTASDGVRIAFWELGEGEPLIYLPPLPQHAQLDWDLPDLRQRYESLAAKHRLIRFDRRNTGLSQREVPAESSGAYLADVEAVRERLGLSSFHLIGHGTSASLAITLAVEFPERVRRLVLVDSALRLPGTDPAPRLQALLATLEHDWESFTEMLSGLVWGWSAGDQIRTYAELIRTAWSWEDAKRNLLAEPAGAVDVFPLLKEIVVPTLVVHHRDAAATTIQTGLTLAAEIPNARLVSLEGRAVAAGLGDPQALSAIDSFLAEHGQTSTAERDIPSGTAIILFADIADSTALTERLGDSAFREKARELESALRVVIGGRSGTPIEGKLLGDGVLATFASAKDAIDAAMEIARSGDGASLPLHVGLHAGDVIREESNVYGGTVNIASRISGLAAPGEVLVSQTVRDLARTSAGVSFEDRGEQELKGVGEPVRVFAVRSE